MIEQLYSMWKGGRIRKEKQVSHGAVSLDKASLNRERKEK